MNPQIPVVAGSGQIEPYPPRVASICQASGQVLAGVLPRTDLTGAFPVIFLSLYRAPEPTGPWFLVGTSPVSVEARETFVQDRNPTFGRPAWYAATAVDDQENESGLSPSLKYVPDVSPLRPSPANPPASAFGQYPLLGSDVFIDPRTGEGSIAPNGDLLAATGLACLAQDLRTRMLTRRGELLLHPDFGLRTAVIGSGQSRPQAMAQMLAADVQDALEAEPRVARVNYVEVNSYDANSWLISYGVMAIGAEDELRANAVFPYDQAVA